MTLIFCGVMNGDVVAIADGLTVGVGPGNKYQVVTHDAVKLLRNPLRDVFSREQDCMAVAAFEGRSSFGNTPVFDVMRDHLLTSKPCRSVEEFGEDLWRVVQDRWGCPICMQRKADGWPEPLDYDEDNWLDDARQAGWSSSGHLLDTFQCVHDEDWSFCLRVIGYDEGGDTPKLYRRDWFDKPKESYIQVLSDGDVDVTEDYDYEVDEGQRDPVVCLHEAFGAAAASVHDSTWIERIKAGFGDIAAANYKLYKSQGHSTGTADGTARAVTIDRRHGIVEVEWPLDVAVQPEFFDKP